MQYDDTFANYGFLSAEAGACRFSNDPQYSEKFHLAREAVREARHSLPSSGDYRSAKGILAAVGFWQQCIESSQAAIILIDRGLPIAAISVLRTAIENFFYFSALIKNPSLFDRLLSKEKYEKFKQASGMLRHCTSQMSEEQVELTTTVQLMNKGGKDWPVFEAAESAGLLSFYESAYRGLSAMGSHATTQSLDRHISISDDVIVLHSQPSSHAIEVVLTTAHLCLSLGTKTFTDQLSPDVVTFGKRLQDVA